MGGSSNHKTNNAARQPENCSLLKMFVPCSGACCEPGETTHTGYRIGDPAVGYCMNGQMMVAKPLSPTDTCDDPFQGTLASPPTWAVCSLEQWIKQHAGKEGAVCDQAWQLPVVVKPSSAAAKGTNIRVLDNAGIQGYVDTSDGDVVNGKFVGEVCFTRAELVALGMRPTDNALRLKSIALVLMNLRNFDDQEPMDFMSRLEIGPTGFTKSPSATSWDSNFVSVSTTATQGNGPGTESDKDSMSESHTIVLGAGEGICMKAWARAGKDPNITTPFDGTESFDVEEVRFQTSLQVLEFFRADDGVNKVEGGCASTLM